MRRNLVPIAQAAEFACVTPKTVRNWIRAGHLNGYRLGPRLLRVDLSELERLASPVPASVEWANR